MMTTRNCFAGRRPGGRHLHSPRNGLAKRGLTLDVHMRRARRADEEGMWRATLQTVWDDIPSDERARLNREKREAHFRKKIEPYMSGDRTERGIAETAAHELLGDLILRASGFLTTRGRGVLY